MNFAKMVRAALVIGLLGAGTFACGDDDSGDDGGGTSGSGAGTGGTAGTAGTTAGTGGTAGTTAGTGGGGTGGSAGMMAPVMCNGMMCPAVMSVQGMLPPCCDMDSGGGCGATVGMMGECEATMQPGDLDTSCPTENSVAGTMVPGCCTPDNECGLMSMTLMGCVERTDYPSAFLSPQTPGLAGGLMTLAAAACGGDADAGTD